MIGELIEKLCIANIKLFMICDKKADMAKNPAAFSKEDVIETVRRDVELCKQRAYLKNQIDKAVNEAIMHGKTAVLDEVKSYGSS